MSRSAKFEATRALIDKDWELFTETAAHVLLGWREGDEAHRLALYMREAVTQEQAKLYLAAIDDFDATPFLSQVKSPTLILHRRQVSWLSEDVPRRLAARIPGARMLFLDGQALAPGVGDVESVLQAVGEFIGVDLATPPHAAEAPLTILFTDIVGHTEMMQRLGDAKGREVLHEHERITRETLKRHGGAEVKTDGDSFMASFASVSSAVECAVALQRAFARYSETSGEPILIRAGLNVGEPIEEEGDFFGSAVILGARIKDQAGGGEILVPEAVRHLLAGKDFLFADRGDTALRGFEDPVRLYEVRWR